MRNFSFAARIISAVPVMDFDDLKQKLAPLVFRLQWQRLTSTLHGTGFFISPNGLALTAYHNVAAALENGEEFITAEWQGKSIPMYWKLSGPQDAKWQQRLDVAVLEARPPLQIEAPVFGLAYLDSSWSREKRAQYWKARSTALMGYRGEFPEEAKLTVGSISLDEPIVDPMVEDIEGNPAGRAEQALNLGGAFQQNCWDTIRGVSGAPLVDRKTDEIVGVQFAGLPNHQRVLAREFHQVAQAWPPFRELARAIPPQPPPPAHRLSRTLSLVGVLGLALTAGAILWWGVPWKQAPPAAQLLDVRPGDPP